MFDFLNVLNKISNKDKELISEEEICALLKTSPEALRVFEDSYRDFSNKEGISDNLFKVNSRQMAEIKEGIQTNVPSELHSLVEKIVNEFVAQTLVYIYDGKAQYIKDYRKALPEENMVTLEDITTLPKELQPDLAGNLIKRDLPDSGKMLLSTYKKFMEANNLKERESGYNIFRQGLDILDLDPLTYSIIDTNPISMGYWLPKVVDAVSINSFFKIPKTKIIKVPLPILQLTRQEYSELTRTTLDIIDEYCHKVFELNDNDSYFIKTGTYSSKFDFRNAKVTGSKEIKELGEYLLFIHWQALQMAHYDLSGRKQPIIYGVSTTTEWVVREFIEDIENNPTIYHGLPLRTEFRVFVDFDTKEVLGIHNYWDANVMEKHFAKYINDPDSYHDSITYRVNREKIEKNYEENKGVVIENIKNFINDIDLAGQWSIDVMKNGNDFYIIDMATAERSAYYNEVVAVDKRRPIAENWLPEII